MSGQIPQRQIGLSFTLAQNSQSGQASTFAETGSSSLTLGSATGKAPGGAGANTLNVQGLRTSVRIRNAWTSSAEATVRVWGLPQSLMNQFSTLGYAYNDLPNNQLAIRAGDNLTGLATIFQGTVAAAWGEYENQPDVPFTLYAQALHFPSTQAMVPTSYPQSFDVASALTSLAQKIGMTVNNYGVNIKLPPMYVSGPPAIQVRKIADAARIDVGVGDLTLDLTLKSDSRPEAAIIISKATGMVASPAFTANGLLVKTIFTPSIKFKSLLNIQSSVLSAITQTKNAQGAIIPSTWTAIKVDLDLDAMVPKGDWLTTVLAYIPTKAAGAFPPAR